MSTRSPTDTPPTSTTGPGVPEHLLQGFLNAHELFRVVLVVSIITLFWVTGITPGSLSYHMICVYIIVLSMLLGRFLRWHWKKTRGEWSYGVGKLATPWIARSGPRPRYPVIELLVDSVVISYLVFRTGGVASVFMVWFPALAATGDFVLYDRAPHRVFGICLSLCFWLSTLLVILGPWTPGHDLDLCGDTDGARMNQRLYVFTATVQYGLIWLLGHVMHRVSRRFVETTPRNKV